MKHGISRYMNMGCRCKVCRRENNIYNKRRIKYGNGKMKCMFPLCDKGVNGKKGGEYAHGLCFAHYEFILRRVIKPCIRTREELKDFGYWK